MLSKEIKQRPIYFDESQPDRVTIIDQRALPHLITHVELFHWEEAEEAISEMSVRGAPLIGVTAAWGMYLAALGAQKRSHGFEFLLVAAKSLKASRPTAVNLAWAVDRVLSACHTEHQADNWVKTTLQVAQAVMQEDIDQCKRIGEHGLKLIEEIRKNKPKSEPVNLLTHCNAGRIACVEYGTATAPMYLAKQAGINIHVWVDETRPRNQGALTSWELTQAGIPNTVIVDNAGGLLMCQKKVDMVIVGADRVTRNGDVANKIGTYLKALAAKDNGIPFYVALPSTTFDWKISDGMTEIPIEERSPDEVLFVSGLDKNEEMNALMLFPESTTVFNPGFDITPTRLITGLITDRGICAANPKSIAELYPEMY